MAKVSTSRDGDSSRRPVPLLAAWGFAAVCLAAATGFILLDRNSAPERAGRPHTLVLPPAAAPSATEPAATEPLTQTASEPPSDAPRAEPQSPDPDQAPEAEAPGQNRADAAPPETAGVATPTEAGLPSIAVVVTGLGLAREVTDAAIDRLPPAITLSFTPYAAKLDRWIPKARARDHEVMIDLPMEPVTFPLDDPGPQALLTSLQASENLERLHWVLERGTGYVGVAAHMGSRFTSSESHLAPVFQELAFRNLLFLDNPAAPDSVAGRVADRLGLPRLASDRALDDGEPSRESVDARLVQIERLAQTHGYAIATGRAYALTINRLVEWVAGLEARGFELVPVTALAGRVRTGQAASSVTNP